jgi:DedD protein
MERQKIFWVVLSVSVFVVVVLVVGVFLLRQRPAASPTAVTPLADGGAQVYEYQREAPASTAAPSPSGTGDQQTLHFYIGESDTTSGNQGTASGSSTTPATTPQVGGAPTGGAQPQVSLPRSTSPTATSAARAPASNARAAKKTTEYWIQTGSYKSQSRAEELATLLANKGLAGRVFSYTSGKETFYRVRVGPYTNRAEAEKFLAAVKQLQGLETSFVSQVAAAGR